MPRGPGHASGPGGVQLMTDTQTRRRGLRRPRGEVVLRNTTVGVIMAFIVVLLIVPIVLALRGSFHNWNPLNGTFEWVGLANYSRLLQDATFWTASLNTIVFGVFAILGRIVLGLLVAYALFSKLTRWRSFFRAVFYVPTVTPLVAVAYVWQLMYHPQFGVINSLFGLDINWLYDSRFAMPAVIAMTIWKDFGYAVILFLAGLYSIPEDVIEAAEVDGATPWKRFWHVTLPLLKPMMVFVVITSMIAYLQAFVQIMVMTGGGPGTSTQIISFMIFEQAFVKYNFGYASAIAFVLLIFTAVLTAISWRIQGSDGPTAELRRMRRAKQKGVATA